MISGPLRILLVLLLTSAPAHAAEVFFNKDCLTQVLKVIKETKHRLSASIFDINQPEIVDALLDLHFDGKEVQILSDRRQGKGDHSRMLDLYLMGVDVRLNSKARLQHNKYAISDDKISMSGSFNWTNSAAKSNKEDLTILRSGLLRWSETRAIADTRANFENDWEKNTEGKSDAYFEEILKEKYKETRERLKPWAVTTLKGISGRDRAGARRLQAAFRLADKLSLNDRGTLDLVSRLAEPGWARETPTRTLAIKALGNARTSDKRHQITLLMAAADANPEVSAAAKAALEAIGTLDPGAREYTGLGAVFWRAKILCFSGWKRLGF